jgi:hypothetical protein
MMASFHPLSAAAEPVSRSAISRRASTGRFAILVIALLGCWTANAQEHTRRVLLLNICNNNYPKRAIVDQATRKRLKELSLANIEPYSEFLDNAGGATAVFALPIQNATAPS